MSLSEHESLTEFQALEAKLDLLIAQYQLLKDENQSLKVKQEVLVKENAELLEKNNQAKVHVETMIARLKAMEQER